jgi:hypothetical protein
MRPNRLSPLLNLRLGPESFANSILPLMHAKADVLSDTNRTQGMVDTSRLHGALGHFIHVRGAALGIGTASMSLDGEEACGTITVIS